MEAPAVSRRLARASCGACPWRAHGPGGAIAVPSVALIVNIGSLGGCACGTQQMLKDENRAGTAQLAQNAVRYCMYGCCTYRSPTYSFEQGNCIYGYTATVKLYYGKYIRRLGKSCCVVLPLGEGNIGLCLTSSIVPGSSLSGGENSWPVVALSGVEDLTQGGRRQQGRR